MSLTLKKDMKEQIDALSVKLDISSNQVIINALKEYLWKNTKTSEQKQ